MCACQDSFELSDDSAFLYMLFTILGDKETKISTMAMNMPQVVSYPAFKARREYFPVALTTASLLSTALKTGQETTVQPCNLNFVHSH